MPLEACGEQQGSLVSSSARAEAVGRAAVGGAGPAGARGGARVSPPVAGPRTCPPGRLNGPERVGSLLAAADRVRVLAEEVGQAVAGGAGWSGNGSRRQAFKRPP